MSVPPDSLVTPRFCGVPTFMRLPLASSLEGLDAAILGLPVDSGSPFRTGARFGPNAIRAASLMLRPINPYRGGINLFEALRLADAGDAMVVPGYEEESLDAVQQGVMRLADQHVVPICLGGDHSVSLAALRAVAGKAGPVALLHFDSHTDTWDGYFGGKRYSAGTPFRRAVEERLVDPSRSIQIGMRGSLFRQDDVSQSEVLGYQVIDGDQLFELGPDGLAQAVSDRIGSIPCYITFDMDFVDPASAPGVQTPEAGGPTARETLRFLRSLPPIDIRGIDIVETNPLYDGPGQITALLAATVGAELLALLAATKKAG